MIVSGQSDIASAMTLSSQSSRTKTALEGISKELSTGKKGDLISATGGDLGKLFSIERALTRLGSEVEAINLAAGKAALTQVALGDIHANIVEFGPQLLSAVERGDYLSSRLIASDARNTLGAVVTSLNVKFGRHSVFSGAGLDQRAISSVEDIVNDISAIVVGATSTSDAILAIDAYFFNSGGGFEANVFSGSTQNASPLRRTDGTVIEYAQKADSFGVRTTIKALAMAVVGSDASNFSGPVVQSDLLREAGKISIQATADIIELRETLGFSEGRIEAEKVRNQAMSVVFELEHSAILSADPYETVTKFEALQGQLQTIYTVTARLSNLSLTNFLR